ncbi:RSP_7527 family protein [Limimaricola sp.]|uniref:RSP_7527 family protein n=1 Tax=Limimaricola sp. TaxID=2211665 RepID=UPI0040596E69
MTQIVRYTHPTQAEMEAVMAEAREMRAALIASFFRGIGQKLRGFHVGGKAPAAA